jgi:hypothetical protein
MLRFLIFLVPLVAPVAIQTAATGLTSTAAKASTSTTPTWSHSRAGKLLPANRNASANWQKAGMLSLGGIPNM